MKKVYLTEKQINSLFSDIKLPKFLFNRVKEHKTFLGNNEAFPPEEDYPFDYKILKQRFQEVTEEVNKIDIDSLNEDAIISELNRLVNECKELEKPIKNNLEKLCVNAVIDLLNIPSETVNLTCELVNKIQPKKDSYRTLPEDSSNRDFDFEDLDDFNNVSKVILKRRLINALIQGASYTYSKYYELYISELYKLDNRLIDLYNKIIVLNDYLLFIKDFKIDDNNPMQCAYVEVALGSKGNKTEINAQGLLFPFLLMETIRGFFELFASHGLPDDNKKAMYVIKQSDFLTAEPWDLRMGVGLWDCIGYQIEDTTLLPYIFSSLCELPTEDFNTIMKEIFAKTKKGRYIIDQFIEDAQKESDKLDFVQTMKQKNADIAVINDGFLSIEDLDNYLLDEEDNNNNEEISPVVLGQCNPDDISFEVGLATPSFYQGKKQIYQLYPVYKNHEFTPSEGVNFRAEDVILYNKHFYQLHIGVDETLRRNNIAYNLYIAFILQGYPVCSIYKNRTATFNRDNKVHSKEDAAIPSLWRKIAQHPNITVEPVHNKNKVVVGIKAYANS